MGNREPLDMSLFVDVYEGDYQLEIGEPTPKGETPNANPKLGIPSQANPKFKDTADHELDDKIKKYRNSSSSSQFQLKDFAKMEKYILDLESEKLFRDRDREKRKEKLKTEDIVLWKDTVQSILHRLRETQLKCNALHSEPPESLSNRARSSGKLNQGAKAVGKGFSINGDNGRPMSTRASHRNGNDIYAQTDCGGRQSEYYAADSPPHSEELLIVNHTKGKGHSRQRSPNTEGSTLDGGKDASRAFSGNLAGPSLRLGLRSSSKQCKECNESARHCSCRFYRKASPYCTETQSPRRNSAPRPASGRIGNGIKRAREGVGGGDSPETVVELDSSEDEEDKEAEPTNVDCQMGPPKKAYGTRIALSPSLEGLKIAYPCRDDPASVEVASHDLPRLNPLEFLNDTVIDFYIKYMQRPENLTEEDKSRFYFFNSFFYKKLCDTVGGQNKKTQADLSKLKRWTKGTNIFEKDYLFVPIHEKWHWSLAIVCHPGATSEDTGRERCILHLDSMSPGHKSNNVFRLLRTYLIREWEHQAEKDGLGDSFQRLMNEDFAVKKIPVPQQENESDCGLFLLHYIELFLKDAPSAFKLSDVDEGRLFGRNWFKPYQASDLRRIIKGLLLEFFEREASRVKEKTETIERPSLQIDGSENLLQSGDVQHVLPSNVEVMESVNSPGQCSPTALVHNQNMPDVLQIDGSENLLQGGDVQHVLHSNVEVMESVNSPGQCSPTALVHDQNMPDVLQIDGSENLLQSGDVQHVLPSNVEVMESVNSPGQCSPTALVHDQNMPDVLQIDGSENLLQSGDVQHVLPSNVEVMESVNSPGQCSPTALVHDQNMPDIDSSGVSTPKCFAMEDAEQHLSNDVVKIDEDTGAPSQANCSDPRESSGLPTAPMLRSPGGSADNTENMKMLKKFTKGNGDLGDDEQNGIALVVDLSPQKMNRLSRLASAES